MNSPGPSVGKYQIVRELGRGASAKVYLADAGGSPIPGSRS